MEYLIIPVLLFAAIGIGMSLAETSRTKRQQESREIASIVHEARYGWKRSDRLLGAALNDKKPLPLPQGEQ